MWPRDAAQGGSAHQTSPTTTTTTIARIASRSGRPWPPSARPVDPLFLDLSCFKTPAADPLAAWHQLGHSVGCGGGGTDPLTRYDAILPYVFKNTHQNKSSISAVPLRLRSARPWPPLQRPVDPLFLDLSSSKSPVADPLSAPARTPGGVQGGHGPPYPLRCHTTFFLFKLTMKLRLRYRPFRCGHVGPDRGPLH